MTKNITFLIYLSFGVYNWKNNDLKSMIQTPTFSKKQPKKKHSFTFFLINVYSTVGKPVDFKTFTWLKIIARKKLRKMCFYIYIKIVSNPFVTTINHAYNNIIIYLYFNKKNFKNVSPKNSKVFPKMTPWQISF